MESHELPRRTQPIAGAAKTRSVGLGTTPRDGDVLVARESAAGRYTIRQLPAAVQISSSSRDEAMQLARRFARMHTVDVWYHDEDSLRLLEAYRADRGLRPAEAHEERRS
jgi:hypothetical protein